MEEQNGPSSEVTAADLEREIRAAVPNATDEDVASASAALKNHVAWSTPVDGSRPRQLVAYGIAKGVVLSIADALEAVKPPPAPPIDPATLRQERTDAFMANTHAARRAAAEPLSDPAPGVPDVKLTTEQYVQRQRFLRRSR